MKLWINPASYDNALKLLNHKTVNTVFVGIDNFSLCNNCNINLDQLSYLIKKKNNKSIYVSINKIFVESDIKKLEKLLFSISKLKIDGIIFADFAVKQICDEIKFQTDFVYNPETLNVNKNQFDFFKQNKINSLALAKELSLEEIEIISKDKNNTRIQLLAEGYGLMMNSKWFLLDNYQKQYDIKHSFANQKIYLKEDLREIPNIAWQDLNGTFIFTGYNITSILYLDKFITYGIDAIRIESFMHDETWITKTLDIYQEAFDLIKNKSYNEANKKILWGKIKSINIDSISSGFLDKKDLLHYKARKSND